MGIACSELARSIHVAMTNEMWPLRERLNVVLTGSMAELGPPWPDDVPALAFATSKNRRGFEIMARFKTANDFRDFANEVRRERRFFHTDAATAFLTAVVETGNGRELYHKTGMELWRAQIGYRDWSRTDENGHEWIDDAPFSPERMKPLISGPPEGRANPRGIAYLYLSTDCNTAISEVRPWSGALVSVGLFKILRDLRIADFTKHEGHMGSFDVLMHVPIGRWQNLTPEEVERAVWADIDTAFSEPVGPQDERIDYVPTQILAELFRHNGFDGIAYRSALSEKGYNVALFDVDAADLTVCHLFKIGSIKYDYKERSNPWFVEDGKYLTTVITDFRPVHRDESGAEEGPGNI